MIINLWTFQIHTFFLVTFLLFECVLFLKSPKQSKYSKNTILIRSLVRTSNRIRIFQCIYVTHTFHDLSILYNISHRSSSMFECLVQIQNLHPQSLHPAPFFTVCFWMLQIKSNRFFFKFKYSLFKYRYVNAPCSRQDRLLKSKTTSASWMQKFHYV